MLETILKKQNPWWENKAFKFGIFSRSVLPELIKNLSNDKIIALLGSRQVGKTSLMYLLIGHLLKTVKSHNIFYFNLDDFELRNLFSSADSFLQYIQADRETKYVFIDEVQRLDNPGLFLKSIHDLNLNLKIIVSGSSQLELRAKLKEFLVGRLRQIEIPRLTYSEMLNLLPNTPKKSVLENMMLYGSYPEIAKQDNIEEKKLLLNDIYQTYLQKDIADFAKIENIDAFNKLLILLAAQIGSLLNVHHLSKTLRVSAQKIADYLDILEGTFIIKRLYPFFKNYKKEISKTPKVYFMDLGLRNLLLANWQQLALRSDQGALFENMVFLELYNQDVYKLKHYHFWRTTNQTEIDFIVEEGTSIKAIEAKYSNSKNPKAFTTFKEYYPKAVMGLITSETIGKVP
ncbi:ATP-binding protein [Candidatus Peregrinibacteria bacterium]|nr:ATP-binding protein [Candidatus Peregrinibacteria bacterium]